MGQPIGVHCYLWLMILIWKFLAEWHLTNSTVQSLFSTVRIECACKTIALFLRFSSNIFFSFFLFYRPFFLFLWSWLFSFELFISQCFCGYVIFFLVFGRYLISMKIVHVDCRTIEFREIGKRESSQGSCVSDNGIQLLDNSSRSLRTGCHTIICTIWFL